MGTTRAKGTWCVERLETEVLGDGVGKREAAKARQTVVQGEEMDQLPGVYWGKCEHRPKLFSRESGDSPRYSVGEEHGEKWFL